MTNQANTILSKLFDITNSFEKDINFFLNSFETDELLSFSNSEEKRKKLLVSYNKFSLKIKNHIERYETTITELSLLICKADKLCDADLTKTLSAEFDRYSALFKSVTKFVRNCEALLLKKDSNVKQSTVMQYARELLVAATTYKNNF